MWKEEFSNEIEDTMAFLKKEPLSSTSPFSSANSMSSFEDSDFSHELNTDFSADLMGAAGTGSSYYNPETYSHKIDDAKHFSELDFKIVNEVSDWYLVEGDLNASFVFPGPTRVSTKLALKRYAELLWEEVTKAIIEKSKNIQNEDFREIFLRISLPDIEDLMIFRGNRIKSIEGDIWALRRVKGVVPNLSDLHLGSSLYNILTSSKIKSGLILIVGETGNGKSTTCASMIKYRCTNQGSFALTVEDPPELPLHGSIGMGVCIQTEVHKGDFSEAIRSAMRSYPAVNNSILYVGEIRDTETARELIRVSANGHLVFATIHGEDVVTGLKRLVDSAVGNEVGNKASEVRNMLASSLRLVVHQKLIDIPPQLNNGKISKAIKANFVLSNGTQGGVGNLILINKLEQIPGVIERQYRLLQNQGVNKLLESVYEYPSENKGL